MRIPTLIGVGVVLAAGMATASWGAVSIPVVLVGNYGNAADTTGYGAMGDYYYIGTNEVTAGQYTVFLNAVAGVDANGLYDPGMAQTDLGSGISRTGSGTVGSPYVYSVDANFVNRPVNYVTFYNAARFVNWLDNGQPTGAQSASTTENGAYDLSGIGGVDPIVRQSGAVWVLPTADEWYKAAYFKPTTPTSTTGTYFDYPTSSNSAPGHSLADASGNNANIYTDGTNFPVDSGKYTTVEGEFQNTLSPYGATDMGGNVAEWTESAGSFDIYSKLLVGGSYLDTGDALLASNFGGFLTAQDATFDSSTGGFRVVMLPEPTSLMLLALGGAGLWVRPRKVRR